MADGTYEVDKVIGRRRTKSGKEEFLVHWKNYDSLYSTWEPIENLSPCLHTVTEFMAKAFPMPGINAAFVTHLESKHPEMRQLRKVTDIDKRKLRSLQNKEMVDEILKVKNMTQELKKYQRGRGRGRKRSQLSDPCEVFTQEAKKLRPGPLNGRVIGQTVFSGLSRKSLGGASPKKGEKKSPGKRGKNGLTCSLLDGLDDDEVLRLTRTTRTHGVLDECVSVLKEGRVWKITLCNERKKIP